MKIRLLGEPAIISDEGRVQAVRGHQSWLLLARVVLSPRPLDRRMLAQDLFPETTDPLGSLRWCLAALRKALNSGEFLIGDPVEPHFPPGLEIDVLQIERDDFDLEAAGPLLGTMDPRCSPELATWLLIERERTAAAVEAQLRRQVMTAISVGDHDRAIRVAELGVRRRPLDESLHILLTRSLILAGRVDVALQHVAATEALFLEELGEKPSPALRSAARRSVVAPPAGISLASYVNASIQSGLAALSAGAVDAGIDCLRRAAGEAERIGDHHLMARSLLELGTALVHAVRGFDDEGAVLLRQSTELSREHGYAAEAAAGYRELGYVDALAGRRASAARYLDAAVAFAEGPDMLAGIQAVAGFNLVDWGRTGEGLGQYRAAIENARTAANRRREIWALGIGARGLVANGELDEAEDWLTGCLHLVREEHWAAFHPWPAALLVEARIQKGWTTPELRQGLEEAFVLSCQLADPCWEAAAARTLSLWHAKVGEMGPAHDWLAEARARCARTTDAYVALQVEIVADQARLSRSVGEIAAADRFGREWVSTAARTQMDAEILKAAAFINGA